MLRREAVREYVGGALWVAPFLAGNTAVAIGFALSRLDPGPGTLLDRLAFQGSADQARDVLTAITGTVVTVIALVLGLSVVALQLSSTQFSPRLLRNFLRDRPNQVVLSVFLATFAYSAAGLFTVGVDPSGEFPRLAVSGSIALLFVSLGGVVYFADHLSHSIQVDAIMHRVQRETLALVRRLPTDVEEVPPVAPPWAVAVRARTSGYVVTAHPELLLPVAVRHGVSIALTRRVGEHVVAGSTLALVWAGRREDPVADLHDLARALDDAVGISFERTRQQDVAMGIRQLVDVASKALSPAINDPYTAVQAVDHLAVIFAAMAEHRLGPRVGRAGESVVVVPSRRFGEYLATMVGLVRRAGSREPTLVLAVLRLLEVCTEPARHDWQRLHEIADQAQLVLAAAERAVVEPADLVAVRDATHAVLARVERLRPEAG